MPLTPQHNITLDGPAVKRRRKRLKLTQALFGRLVGVGAKTISKWERGHSKVSGDQVRLLLCLDFVPDEGIQFEWRNYLMRAAGSERKALEALFMLIRPEAYPVTENGNGNG